MIQKIRRYVTGLDEAGRTTIAFDDLAPNAVELKAMPGVGITEVWVTDEAPVDNSGAADRSLRPLRHDPTPNGTIFRVVEIPPDRATDKADAAKAFEEMGSANKPSGKDAEIHHTMHKTDSIDYLVVISGEMWMVMENGQVLLRQGDCIVQRGTKHAWVNKSDKPCLLAAVLVPAVPL